MAMVETIRKETMATQTGCNHNKVDKAQEHMHPAIAVCEECGQVFDAEELIDLVKTKNETIKKMNEFGMNLIGG